MKKLTIGFAICGSFCTFSDAIPQMRRVVEEGMDVIPIMSEIAYSSDTRFGKAADFRAEIESICGREIIHTIPQAEPIGPKKLLDALVVAPCTGNTISKVANGITDTSVTMAIKAQLRNSRPVLLAIATNDAISGSAASIGKVMNTRNIYFVPLRQDNPAGKPASLVARLDLLVPALYKALDGEQLQPFYAENG